MYRCAFGNTYKTAIAIPVKDVNIVTACHDDHLLTNSPPLADVGVCWHADQAALLAGPHAAVGDAPRAGGGAAERDEFPA